MAKTGLFGISTSASGGGGGTSVITTVAQKESVIDITGAVGVVQASWTSFTFVVNQGTILIDGQTFRKGTYSWSNLGGFLSGMSYDASGSIDAKIMLTQP